jgi:hypothetical protein
MELVYKYREHLKEYCVEDKTYYYYMPYTYILQLQDYLKQAPPTDETPIENWYLSLKDIERRVVYRKSKDEEKLSSLW